MNNKNNQSNSMNFLIFITVINVTLCKRQFNDSLASLMTQNCMRRMNLSGEAIKGHVCTYINSSCYWGEVLFSRLGLPCQRKSISLCIQQSAIQHAASATNTGKNENFVIALLHAMLFFLCASANSAILALNSNAFPATSRAFEV